MSPAASSLLGRVHRALWAGTRATLAGALVLTAFRIAFVARHGAAGFPYRAAEVARALSMGARFDLKVAAVGAIPLVVLVAACGRGRARAVPAAWAVAVGFVLALTAMINDGYYAYYHVPIDPIVFGLFEDDTAAVLRSLWTDHPIVLGPLAALALGAAQAWLALRPRARPPSVRWQVVAAVALPALFFLVVRGRIGGYPLHAKDFSVTSRPFLNAAVPNGPIALLVAAEERGTVEIGADAAAGLRGRGFGTPAQAAAALGLAPATASDEAVAEALFARTPENAYAAAHPPHVVLAVMESFGADLLRYHSARNDLLGRLAPHLDRGLLWRSFLSAQPGTHPTLEALLLASPITPLTMGEPGSVPFEQASARPFHDAGYRTVFALGWGGNWRGFSRSMPLQGFDELRDMNDVLALVPDAPVGIWGVPDAALFRWAEHRLREADAKGERLFLVLMSGTNHSPHAVPAGYQVRPLDPAVLEGRALGDAVLRVPEMQTYQYANDALGGFLDALEGDGLAARTVVAVTGDHTTRGFFRYPGVADLPLSEGVPFFLAAPAPYLAGRTPDVTRWASHRDVLPTLAALVLPRARVFRGGEDLLAPPARTPRALARYDLAVSAAGAIPSLARAEVYCFGSDGVLSATPGGPCAAALEAIRREERAYVGLLDWFVRRQAIAARTRGLALASGGAARPGAAAPRLAPRRPRGARPRRPRRSRGAGHRARRTDLLLGLALVLGSFTDRDVLGWLQRWTQLLGAELWGGCPPAYACIDAARSWERRLLARGPTCAGAPRPRGVG